MTISFHSHSGQFCAHAKGTLEEVVKEAIRKGFTTFGLSEHVPRYRSQDLYPEEEELGVAHLAQTFESFLVEAWRLKSLYAAEITLLVGLETEFIDRDGLEKLSQLRQKHLSRIQYLVGSVHHCHEKPIDFDKPSFDSTLASFPAPTQEEQFTRLFETYYDNQLELFESLKPEVIGHFDLCRLYYPSTDFRKLEVVWSKIERNVRFAIDYGALFEVNASAFRKGWSTAYPGKEVFELIQRLGGRFTLSDDSHGPQAVGLHYTDAYRYLEEMDLHELWYLAETRVGGELVAKRVEGRPWLDTWRTLLDRTQ